MDYDNLDFWEMIKSVWGKTQKDFGKEFEDGKIWWCLAGMEQECIEDCNYSRGEAMLAFEKAYYDYIFDIYVQANDSTSDYNLWCTNNDPTPQGAFI